MVLCSHISLFAILSVIRHALDNFAIEQASNEILSELAIFDRQWKLFAAQMETVGRRIESAQTGFESLKGTRSRALDRPLQRIQEIRKQRDIPDAPEVDSIESEDPVALPETELIETYTEEK